MTHGGGSVFSAQVIVETWRAADLPPLHAVEMWYRSTVRVVFVTWHGDESSPLHCVIPFIRTGCIRYLPSFSPEGGHVIPGRGKKFVIYGIPVLVFRHMLNWPFSCKMYQYKMTDLVEMCKIHEKFCCYGNENVKQRLILGGE